MARGTQGRPPRPARPRRPTRRRWVGGPPRCNLRRGYAAPRSLWLVATRPPRKVRGVLPGHGLRPTLTVGRARRTALLLLAAWDSVHENPALAPTVRGRLYRAMEYRAEVVWPSRPVGGVVELA